MTKRPVRFFNTTGPCNPNDHYMLPPEERLVGAQLSRYIGDKLYWVLHAPRQTGKTTFLQNWARKLNASGEVVACYVSVEECQGVSETEKAMPAICNAIRNSAESFGVSIPPFPENDPHTMLSGILTDWAKLVVPKPLIVLFDEVDVLQDDALVSFLRQLRKGFATRGTGTYPISVALVGMRDLKDYIVRAKDGKQVNPGSPFNVKSDSVSLSNFTKENIKRLFAERTTETGQQIEQAALDYVWEQSRGQPWIVNNLFMRATMRILDKDDNSTVTLAHVQEARHQMILARETHLDALAYRLDDPKIRQIIESLMIGEADPNLATGDAFRLCLDLGLVSQEDGVVQVANPIYREILARHITVGPQAAIPKPDWKWKKDDGTLDMEALLKEFQKFWRANADEWEEKSDYTEAFPHTLLMAFLQRVVNGGGRIDREYAAGRGRMDLLVEYGGQKYIIEIKITRYNKSIESVKKEGFEQIRRYRDTVAPDAPAYLVVFDRRHVGRTDENGKIKKPPAWSKRITWKVVGDVTVVGG
ncbi:hypothetical protein AGMMS49938_05040 [Fibrobacterales bacterium]|nr:hypothetical protein AGMMS49938_05040 [Fibrobacterales bacterium]